MEPDPDQPPCTDKIYIPKGAAYYIQVTTDDQELLAVAACVDVVTRCCPDEKSRERVMRYLWDRFSP